MGPPMVEIFARLQTGILSEEEVRYCRTVTAVWCGFFAANGLAALGFALAGSLAAWTAYNGFVAYGLMGLLFAGEVTVRSYRFRRYEGGLADPLFRRLFPPRPST